MSSWRAFCETLHLVALGLWLGMLVAVGAAAAVSFPAMKSLGVRVVGFPGEGADHYRLVAGRVVEQVFLVGDSVMFPCALIALGTLAVLLRWYKVSVKRPATIVRVGAMAVSIACLAALLLVVTPSINRASRLHFEAAKVGDAAASAEHMRAVDDLHPLASNLMLAEFVGVLAAFWCGAWSLARPKISGEASFDTGSRYEEPALLKGGRA